MSTKYLSSILRQTTTSVFGGKKLRQLATAALEYPRESETHKSPDPRYFAAAAVVGGGVLVGGYSWYRERRSISPSADTSMVKNAKAGLVSPTDSSLVKPGCGKRSDWPIYTRDQVAEHATVEMGVWVTYLDSVYDVTSFVYEHPGGDQILLAAGAGLEPYAVHKNNKEVNGILERLKIGVLAPSEIE